MKGLKYVVSIKVAENMIFSSESKKKEVEEWISAYEENNSAEEIKVYIKNSKENTYELMYKDCRRKIGF